MKLALVAIVTLVFALVFVFLARSLAPRIGLVATPRKDRWHKKPTPLLGGAAIYAAFVLGFAAFTPGLSEAYPILAAGTLLFVTGLIDDAVHIKPHTKLIIQLVAAAGLVTFGLHLPWVEYAWINDLLT